MKNSTEHSTAVIARIKPFQCFYLSWMLILCSMFIKHNDSCRRIRLLLFSLFLWIHAIGSKYDETFFVEKKKNALLPVVWTFFYYFSTLLYVGHCAPCNAWLILLAFLNKWRIKRTAAIKYVQFFSSLFVVVLFLLPSTSFPHIEQTTAIFCWCLFVVSFFSDEKTKSKWKTR